MTAENPRELPAPLPKDPAYLPPPRNPERSGPVYVAEITALEGHLKHGLVGGFSLRCDEGPNLGGEDTAPTPLGYFTAAIGFCLSTQIVQVARALKLEPRNVRVRVTSRFFREGSVIIETAKTVCDAIETEVAMDIDAPPELTAQLIRMAEATCYTVAALRDPVPLSLTASVNGAAFDFGVPQTAAS